MRPFVPLSSVLFLICSVMLAEATDIPSLPRQFARVDTIIPRKSSSTDNLSRQNLKPMILPGTMLDTTFSTLPAQSLAVGKAAPGWLRKSVQGSPHYVIDGVSATVSQLQHLKQKEVVSTYQMDGQRAQNLYGKNARNGLFIITTKSGVAPK